MSSGMLRVDIRAYLAQESEGMCEEGRGHTPRGNDPYTTEEVCETYRCSVANAHNIPSRLTRCKARAHLHNNQAWKEHEAGDVRHLFDGRPVQEATASDGIPRKEGEEDGHRALNGTGDACEQGRLARHGAEVSERQGSVGKGMSFVMCLVDYLHACQEQYREARVVIDTCCWPGILSRHGHGALIVTGPATRTSSHITTLWHPSCSVTRPGPTCASENLSLCAGASAGACRPPNQ
jgi:hypothetical protein